MLMTDALLTTEMSRLTLAEKDSAQVQTKWCAVDFLVPSGHWIDCPH